MAACLCGCGGVAINKYVHGHNSRVAHGMKGKTHSEESRKKMVVSRRGIPHTEEWRKNIGFASKRAWAAKSEEEREQCRRNISAGEKGRVHSEEARKRISESKKGKRCSPGTEFTSELLKARYLDPAYIAKVKAAWNMKPNKAELFLMGLLDRLYPGQWKYTGDFSMTINGKCPDFVNCNGQKKIIEYFGDHWHQGETSEDRAAVFAPFGYQTLVIWGSEMKNMGSVVSRIHAFMEA